MATATPDLSSLPESARAAIIELARLLATGFTGKVELECHQGGIRDSRLTIHRKLAGSPEGR